MASKINIIGEIKDCIINKKSFVLQGGAGSGKTETLKEIVEMMAIEFPKERLLCITHTNVAADEIKSRTGDKYLVLTIHAFLYSIIKNYQVNIKSVIAELFKVEKMVEPSIGDFEDEKEFRKANHEKYKKIYEKLKTTRYRIAKQKTDKVVGKRDFDKDSAKYVGILNEKIEEINLIIEKEIQKVDYTKIKYNETKFDNYKSCSFGHDGLLKISVLLIEKYPLLKKIICDKFSIIFIDEFQDSNTEILKCFIDTVEPSGITLGLFGDEMQAIYSDGIGTVDKYIENSVLKYIHKPDNYRCSYEIVKFINRFRIKKEDQEVALKRNETKLDRTGPEVRLFYSVYENKPKARSNFDEKSNYLDYIDGIIEAVKVKLGEQDYKAFKKLLLSNSAVSKKLKFENLYDAFNERYSDVKDQIEKEATSLMWLEMAEMVCNYQEKKHNKVITQLKRNGFCINNLQDKQKICQVLDILIKYKLSAQESLQQLFDSKFLKESDSRKAYINYAKNFLNELSRNEDFLSFMNVYSMETNTAKRMNDSGYPIDEDDFDDLDSLRKRKVFYEKILSNDISLIEIVNYYNYLQDKLEYMTMHKTKGTGIEKVIVVADEYFWESEYNFQSVFDMDDTRKQKQNTQRVFYVACSRAIKELVVIRIIEANEEINLLSHFNNISCEKI